MLLATGETKFDIHAGKVLVDGKEFDVPVSVGKRVPGVLFGRQWLKTLRLVVDMPLGVLTLG